MTTHYKEQALWIMVSKEEIQDLAAFRAEASEALRKALIFIRVCADGGVSNTSPDFEEAARSLLDDIDRLGIC